MNHEYINPEYFFAVTGSEDWYHPEVPANTKKMLAAHGVSVIEVRKGSDGKWSYVKNSSYNRRITGYTPMSLTGPAAGNDLLKTAADATGTEVLGTLNNCGAGQTPWGTYITCEENFNGYFGTDASGFTPTTLQNRYGLAAAGFGYGWHKGDPRFDLAVNPNEAHRHGWIVEIDPYAPASKPKKRTALGRFKHENAECVLSKNNRAVVYSGDDERNEYLYKFVSDGVYNPANKASGANLLDSGTLYVARFDAGTVVGDNQGTGVWLPLVFGQNGLTPENGFANQAEVLIKARQAADRVGATMMDRPEWVAANRTKAGEVFLACTNNNRRGSNDTHHRRQRPPCRGRSQPARRQQLGPCDPLERGQWRRRCHHLHLGHFCHRRQPGPDRREEGLGQHHGRQHLQLARRHPGGPRRPSVDSDRRQLCQHRRLRRPGQQPDAGR